MTRSRLYPLLPAWYRAKDADAGLDADGRAPIEAFVARIEAGFEDVHAAAGRAYDDWFVETCAPEVLPALGTLVGLELTGPSLPGDRRLVADALTRWRRKGSAWALREALEAASGWPVQIREFERTLLSTLATSHPRNVPHRRRTQGVGVGTASGPNLRRIEIRVRRGFEVVVADSDAFELGDGWYAVDAGGRPIPVSEEQRGLRVRVDGARVHLHAPSLMLARAWEASPELAPEGGAAVLDARRGRFWLPPPLRKSVRVDAAFWRPGPIGAGLPVPNGVPPADAFRVLVAQSFTDGELGPGRYRSIPEALREWPLDRDADVRILDSRSYSALHVESPPGRTLILQAHPGELPCVASLRVEGPLVLCGVLVAGDLQASGADVQFRACCVRGSSSIGGGTIERSITGPVELTGAGQLQVLDSVIGSGACDVDAEPASHSVSGTPREGLKLWAERTTFLGAVSVGEVIRARDSLFCAPVSVARPHPGRFEHCVYPNGSRTGADAHAFEPADAPRFISRSPDAPGYASLVGPDALLRAASDGGEPGAFHGLHVWARMARLEQMLGRFLPAGFIASVEVVQEGSDG